MNGDLPHGYRRRMVDDLLAELLRELPAVLLTGPRTFQLAPDITAAPISTLWS